MNNPYDRYLCRDTIISKGAVAYGSDGSMSVASPIYQDKYGRLYFYEDGEKYILHPHPSKSSIYNTETKTWVANAAPWSLSIIIVLVFIGMIIKYISQ